MKPEITYSEAVTHNGMDLKILGESFDEPVRKTQDQQFYTQVSVIDVNTDTLVYKDGQPIRFFMPDKLDVDKLMAFVRSVRDNIEKVV